MGLYAKFDRATWPFKKKKINMATWALVTYDMGVKRYKHAT